MAIESEYLLLKDPRVLSAIASFIPKQVFERVSRNPDNLDRVGERREVSIIFVDIAGFTPLCEGRDAEEVIFLLNDLFSKILEPVSKYDGTVDKFMGDAAMILFGAPVFHEDDPKRAIAASLEIIDRVAEIEGLEVSIGINTGQVVAGVVGNNQHREYTTIGDAVNIASRLESSASSGEILVGPETYKKTKDLFIYSKPRALLLKGKNKPIQARRAICIKNRDAVNKIPQLIGRENELKYLTRLLSEDTNTIILGEAGYGKTLMLNHLRRKIATSGYSSIFIEGARWSENIPYAPLQRLIGQILGSNPQKKIKQLLPELNDTFPLFSGILNIHIPDTDKTRFLKPTEKRDILDKMIIELFSTINKNKKIFFFVDGAENLDPSTIRILDSITGLPRFTQIISARQIDEWITKISQNVVKFRSLNAKSSKSLLKYSLGTNRISSELADIVYKTTKGHPGYIVELAKLLKEQNKIKFSRGVATLDGNLNRILPGGIENIMAARIDNLPPDARELVRLASVFGIEFPERLLTNLAGESLIEHGLDDLISADFLSRIGNNLKFISLPTMLAAYESLFLSSRKKIHIDAAKEIELLYADSVQDFYEVLAQHYSLGDIDDKALIYSIKAGKKQENKFANREALYYYEKALATPDKNAINWKLTDEIFTAIELAGKLYWYAGNLDRVIALNKRSLALAVSQNRKTIESDSLNRIALANHELGKFDSAMKLYEKLLVMLKSMPKENERLLQALTNYGTLLSDLGDLDKAKKLYLSGLANTPKTADSPGVANLMGNLGWLEAQIGELNLAEEYLERSGKIDNKLGNLRGSAINSVNLAQIYRLRGDKKNEAEQYTTALKIFEQIGDRRGVALCFSNLGDTSREMGNIVQARKFHRKALLIAREIDDSQRIVDAELGLAMEDAIDGKFDAAIKGVKKAYKIAASSGDWEGQIDTGIALLDLYSKTGDKSAYHILKKNLKQVIAENNPSALERLGKITKP